MKVTQLHELVNLTVTEVLGTEAVVNEDLTNMIDVGKEIIDTDNLDNYVKKLVNHIGKVIFTNRLYSGGVPSVLMDSWEYGSILEKVSADLPEATENASWSLTNGTDYSPDVFYQPSVSAKFFNSKITFEIPMSFTEKQVKESFSSASQLNGFISMLTTSIENAMTIKLDNLIMRTLNNMTAETLVDGLGETLDATKSTQRAVNLLTLYNMNYPEKTIKNASECLTSPDFIRYATYMIGTIADRMSKISTLFNIGGKERFTPKGELHTVLLSDFANASETFLKADTYHQENVALPKYESVPYWQGSGKDYDLDSTTLIDVKTSTGKVVKMKGIIGVMFDSQALGVSNLDRRVTTNYNPKAEFYTNFYKMDAGYYNDLNENFVVFFVPTAGAEA